ncbi:E3 ubiquitin-protein ligase TRAIP-like [Dendronephthya gigantea]|uniref:E3 ubiquitin-protein ligase TRAIP-like n=1 Tax=Dendronephthya gigantea TaxID=151771 RepID=UPI00106CE7B0|nr:E3 ubiquitin-protein ligase TRAIP-like [Dendronephthya gigantea]
MFHSPCTICTDFLTLNNLAACPCGHVYHDHCLETWHKRSRTCPTCRKPCPQNIRLFFSDVQEHTSSSDDIITVKNELRKQAALNLEKDARIKSLNKSIKDTTGTIEDLKCRVLKYEKDIRDEKSIQETLKKQIQFFQGKSKHVEKLEKKVVLLKTNLEELERLRKMLHGTSEEAEDMLRNIGTSSKTASELAAQLVIMKRENEKMREAKKKASAEKVQLERDSHSLKHNLRAKELECNQLTKDNENLQDQLKETEQEKLSLKKKVDKMQQSFATSSPRGTLINRLLQESPAPLSLDETVILSSDTDIDENVEFTDGGTERKSAMLKKPKADFTSPVHPGALQRNRKRSYVALENPGRLSTGYNGLGGHSTVLLPSQAKKIKKVAKPQSVSKFVRTKTNPPLPRM